jgi:microcystin-dependent protein
MSCNNCYNGCVETTSDKCVRYTGNDVPDLSIENGDSLFVVEQALIDAVVSFLDGTGIDITVDPTAYCALVTGYLPVSPTVTTPTAVQLFEALVKAACSLQTQVTAINATLTTLNADYTIGCLTGVTASSDTHAIVQAVITKLCQLGVDLAALALDVDTNYVKISDVNSYIAAYIAANPPVLNPSANNYERMVPYVAYEYYGSLTGFDTGTGIGSGVWTKVYLCNGLNNTPDKRGRVAVGAIQLAGTNNALSAAVDPAVNPAYNPNYAVNQILGSNSVTLLSTQIPAHTHNNSINNPTHTHFTAADVTDVSGTLPTATSAMAKASTFSGDEEYALRSSATPNATLGLTSPSTLGLVLTNVDNIGGGNPHDNKQPVIAAYYIMYIP